MRREKLYLVDMVEAADAIARFLSGVEERAILSDDLIRSAVTLKFTIIGEAAARLLAEFRSRHPEIACGDMIGFRNVAAHGYFGIRWPTVWIASEQVPALRPRIAAILAADFPGET